MPTKEREIKQWMYGHLFGNEGSVTMDEFTRAFEAIISQIIKFEKKIKDENSTTSDELRRFFFTYKLELASQNSSDFTKLKKEASSAIFKALDEINKRVAAIKQPKDGKDARVFIGPPPESPQKGDIWIQD